MNFFNFNNMLENFIKEVDFFERLINFSINNLNIISIKITYCFDGGYTVFYFDEEFRFEDISEERFHEENDSGLGYPLQKNLISEAYKKDEKIISKVTFIYSDLSKLNIEEETLFLNAVIFAIEKYDYKLNKFFDNFSKASTFFFQKISNPAVILDSKKRVILKNKSMKRLIEPRHKVYHLVDILNMAINKDVIESLQKALKNNSEWKGILWIKKNDSNVFPQEMNVYIKNNSEGQAIFYYLVFNDITAQSKIEKELIYYANYDFLTALPNRKGFNERVNELVGKKVPFHLILIDLDKFKFINEHYGHPYGDELLVVFSRRLKRLLPENVFKCRLSGDEFVIIFEESNDEDVKNKLNIIFESFRKAIIINNTDHFLTLSAGVTKYPEFGSSLSSLISSSEYSLKRSKQIEGNSYIFYNEHLKKQHLEKLTIIQKLKTAIKNKEFEVNYQPIFNNKGEIVKAEALIRWRDFEGKYIPPCIFIPIAEEAGLIKHISIIVGDIITSDLTFLGKIGFKNFQISINISLKDFEEKFFNKENVLDILIENKRLSKNIIIEVTESLFMKENINYVEQLKRLKNLGFTIALDDFGTGYSSLSYLTKLPIDIIKIDKSFVISLDNEKSRELVKIIVHMASVLNLEVVAEGVEEKWHMDYLDYLDCDYFQGYYLKKPVDFIKLTSMLERKYIAKGDNQL